MLKENHIESRLVSHDIMSFARVFYPNLLNIIKDKREYITLIVFLEHLAHHPRHRMFTDQAWIKQKLNELKVRSEEKNE